MGPLVRRSIHRALVAVLVCVLVAVVACMLLIVWPVGIVVVAMYVGRRLRNLAFRAPTAA